MTTNAWKRVQRTNCQDSLAAEDAGLLGRRLRHRRVHRPAAQRRAPADGDAHAGAAALRCSLKLWMRCQHKAVLSSPTHPIATHQKCASCGRDMLAMIVWSSVLPQGLDKTISGHQEVLHRVPKAVAEAAPDVSCQVVAFCGLRLPQSAPEGGRRQISAPAVAQGADHALRRRVRLVLRAQYPA